jgi:hypothetical protein
MKSKLKPTGAIGCGSHKPGRAVTSHPDDYEMLLVRTGHHLWRWYKQSLKNLEYSDSIWLKDALQLVWEAKLSYRLPSQAAREQNRQAKSERMRNRHAAARRTTQG